MNELYSTPDPSRGAPLPDDSTQPIPVVRPQVDNQPGYDAAPGYGAQPGGYDAHSALYVPPVEGQYPSPAAPQRFEDKPSVFDGCAGQVLFSVMSAFVFGIVGSIASVAIVSSLGTRDAPTLVPGGIFMFFAFGFVGFVAGFLYQGARGWSKARSIYKFERDAERARRDALVRESMHDPSYQGPASWPGGSSVPHVDVDPGSAEDYRY